MVGDEKKRMKNDGEGTRWYREGERKEGKGQDGRGTERNNNEEEW
jgi:hypothetical protein